MADRSVAVVVADVSAVVMMVMEYPRRWWSPWRPRYRHKKAARWGGCFWTVVWQRFRR